MIFLNPNQQSVSANGKSSHLTPKEFQVLHFLMPHSGCTFLPEEIYRHAWQEEPFEVRPIISVHIRHIREKIEVNPSRPVHVHYDMGLGYRFNARGNHPDFLFFISRIYTVTAPT